MVQIAIRGVLLSLVCSYNIYIFDRFIGHSLVGCFTAMLSVIHDYIDDLVSFPYKIIYVHVQAYTKLTFRTKPKNLFRNIGLLTLMAKHGDFKVYRGQAHFYVTFPTILLKESVLDTPQLIETDTFFTCLKLVASPCSRLNLRPSLLINFLKILYYTCSEFRIDELTLCISEAFSVENIDYCTYLLVYLGLANTDLFKYCLEFLNFELQIRDYEVRGLIYSDCFQNTRRLCWGRWKRLVRSKIRAKTNRLISNHLPSTFGRCIYCKIVFHTSLIRRFHAEDGILVLLPCCEHAFLHLDCRNRMGLENPTWVCPLCNSLWLGGSPASLRTDMDHPPPNTYLY